MNEDALKERLKVIAKNKDVNFNEIWKQLLLERFLARVSHSVHHDKFIFKGGLLLAQYIAIGRETTDIDFLMNKIKSQTPEIEAAFREIALVNITDGFQFKFEKIEELTQPHMEYPGYRINLAASFGKMKDKIQTDIGVGDLVNPVENNFRPFEYKGKPIFAGEITLLTYPVVSIFSEKLETVISKGAFNSRMKDYHDLLLILREPGLLDPTSLNPAISATFKHRGTPLTLPIEFDESGIEALERRWATHLASLGVFRQKLNLPETIEEVIAEINAWMSKNGFIRKVGHE
jgi:predicted nucleotidyltransferase component of viral defense system